MLKNTNGRQKDYSLQKKAAEKILTALFLVLSLFVLVSFCTDKTGTFGTKTADFLTGYAGGALVIPLCFAVYVCICRIFSKEVPNFVRQTAATLLLYLAASAVLGIKELTDGESTVHCLRAGKAGRFIAEKAFGTLGAFGTLLAGVVCMYIVFLLYGLPINGCIKNCAMFVRTKLFRQNEKKKKKAESNNGAKAAIEKPFAEELFPPPPEIFGPEEAHDNELKPERCMPLGEKMIKALDKFGVQAELADILVGPTVIQFRITLGSGIRTSKVAMLSNDIALALAVSSIRIETPVPGTSYVGIEIPNPHRRGIPMRTMIEDDSYRRTKYALPMPFGVTVSGESTVIGLETLPHLLVAGTTGSGKSVFINSCIVGLCSHCTPDELRLILVDPKRVEFAVYDKLPHLLTPPVASPKKAVHTLAWAVNEMERRFSDFESARVRNLEAFNARPNLLPKDRKPHIVIIVDELADLMMTASKEVEDYIVRLAQKARAAGIHLILATQRPSVNVITGLIKANIPARVAFSVATGIDSRTIIDGVGAEKLLGKGDMLFLSTKNPKPVRIQSPWIADDILGNWLQYINNLFGDPVFFEDVEAHSAAADTKDGTYDDDMLEQAVEYVLESGIASASNLQRRLRVGFSRASRLLDMMEQLGIVGPSEGSKGREILVDEAMAQERLDEVLGER